MKQTVTDTSERITVEVSKPYRVTVAVNPSHVRHGERVDATTRLTNLAFEEQLQWETSTLDGDFRATSNLAPRISGNNERVINQWAEGHVALHLCAGEETWVSPAFQIAPVQIRDLRIHLEQAPDWMETWNGAPISVDCVRRCNELDGLISELLLPSVGQFVRRGTRTYFEPRIQPREESGRSPEAPPLPPLPAIRQTGLLGVISPRVGVGPNNVFAVLKGKPSGPEVRIPVDEKGRFATDDWPFGEDTATLTVSAPGFIPRTIEGVRSGTTLGIGLFPDTARVLGQVYLEGTNRNPQGIVVFARRRQDEDFPEGTPYGAVPDEKGRFEIGGLARGELFVIEARSELGEEVWTPASVLATLTNPVTEVELVLREPKPPKPKKSVTVRGVIGGPEGASAEIIVHRSQDGRVLAKTSTDRRGNWMLGNVRAGQLVQLKVIIDGCDVFFSPPFRTLKDIRFPDIRFPDIRLESRKQKPPGE